MFWTTDSSIMPTALRYGLWRRRQRLKGTFRLSVLSVVALDEKILNQAVDSDFADFEDAIQYFSATRISADCIISRNLSHYKNTDIPVMTPREFFASSSGIMPPESDNP